MQRRTLLTSLAAIFIFTVGAVEAPLDDHAYIYQPIAEVKLDKMTLEKAIESLREQTHANIVVRWDELERAGIRRDAPVQLTLWDTQLGRALDVLLTLAGGTGSGAAVAKDGIIVVGPPEDFGPGGDRLTRIYDVRDIIDDAMAFEKTHLRQWFASTGPATSRPSPTPFEGVSTPMDLLQQVTDSIEATIAPSTWTDNGGSAGAIRAFAGRLIITQTPANQRRIVSFLRTLRAGGSREGTDVRGD